MKSLLLIVHEDITYLSIAHLLKNTGYAGARIKRCICPAEMDLVDPNDIELVLADLTLHGPLHPGTFEKVINKFPHTPIIALSNIAETEFATDAIRLGAQDCLVKDQLSSKMLENAIHYAIERKKILRSLFVEKQNLQAIINSTSDIIWSIDNNKKIISANDAFWARVKIITGKNHKEIDGADFNRDVFKTWLSYFDRAFTGEVYKVIWSQTINEEVIHEEVSFNPLYDNGKGIIGVCCLSRDITKLRSHLDMIEKQNKQLREIARIQSHEVRGPVADILGLAELFNLDMPGDMHNVEILNNVKTSAEKLDAVINKINEHTYNF